MLINGTGRTDFQNGNAKDAYNSIFNKLLKLPEETFLYPAHDYKGEKVSTIGKEKKQNPRLQVNSVDEYIDIMNNLDIKKPAELDFNVSKNIKTEQEKFDLAASFQKTVEEILYKKTKIAFNEFEKQNSLKDKIFVVAGGVAANKKIRSMLINLCNESNYTSIFPPIELCGDNAAMIAMVGLEKFKLKQFSNLDHPAKPRWPLDENAAFLKGAGVQL